MPKKRTKKTRTPTAPVKEPDFYKLNAYALMEIMGHLSNDLDKFHFSVVAQHTYYGRGLPSSCRPRELFKSLRKKRRKKPYNRPPNIKSAVRLTSSWIRDKRTKGKRNGFCWECLQNNCFRTFIDITQDDRHPKCGRCIRGLYNNGKRKMHCSCGDTLVVGLKEVWPTEKSAGSPKIFYLCCHKWYLRNHIRKYEREHNPSATMLELLFIKKYNMSVDQYDTLRETQDCVEFKQLTTTDGYWHKNKAKWKKKHKYQHRFCYHPEDCPDDPEDYKH